MYLIINIGATVNKIYYSLLHKINTSVIKCNKIVAQK